MAYYRPIPYTYEIKLVPGADSIAVGKKVAEAVCSHLRYLAPIFVLPIDYSIDIGPALRFGAKASPKIVYQIHRGEDMHTLPNSLLASVSATQPGRLTITPKSPAVTKELIDEVRKELGL